MSPEARQALDVIVAESIVMGGHPTATYESAWLAACRYTWGEAAKYLESDGREFLRVWQVVSAIRERAKESA